MVREYLLHFLIYKGIKFLRNLRDSVLKKFRASRLDIDEQLYKEAKRNVQKLIKNEKRDFYQEKLREYFGKPKDLWEAPKSFG